MTVQPEWSGAVQRELDGLQRNVDTRLSNVENRFSELSKSLDKLLTLNEYHADKRADDIRFTNLNEKVSDNDTAITTLHGEVTTALNNLRHEVMTALNQEREDRKTAIKEYIDAKKSQFRWLVSMVMIPIGIAVVDLLLPHKK